VVYAGMDCKIMINSHYISKKKPVVEKIVEKLIFFSIFLCFGIAAVIKFNYIFLKKEKNFC